MEMSMKADLEKAVALLNEGGYTCVLCKGDTIYSSKDRGVKPLLGLLDDGIDVKGFSAADKVVGKAAALLYLLLGVETVYAGVISQAAKKPLEMNGVGVVFDTCVEAIRNRDNTGFCPMETSVWHCENPLEAVGLIKQKLAVLQQQ